MSRMNVPNRITLFRTLLVPVFVACFYLDGLISWWNIPATAIFLVASLSDVLDGYLARKHHLITNFGKLLDPMADKLLYCSAFIMLTGIGRLSPVLTCIFIGREFIVSAFRLVAARANVVIGAGVLGKLKSTFQSIAIVLTLLNNPVFSLINVPLDRITIWIALFFTVWSGFDYIWKNRKAIDWS